MKLNNTPMLENQSQNDTELITLLAKNYSYCNQFFENFLILFINVAVESISKNSYFMFKIQISREQLLTKRLNVGIVLKK